MNRTLLLVLIFSTYALADWRKSTLSRQFYSTVYFDSPTINMPISGPKPNPCTKTSIFVGSGGAISAHCISAAHRYCQNTGVMLNMPLDAMNAVGIIQEVNLAEGAMGIVCIIPELP